MDVLLHVLSVYEFKTHPIYRVFHDLWKSLQEVIF